MFTILTDKILRWGTPDPAYDWLMFGHLVIGDDGLVMVDPPVVPGLLQNSSRLGRIEAVVLTTLDHSRGSAYITERTGARLYVPDQTAEDVDPAAMRLLEEVRDHETYSEGEIEGFEAFRLKTAGDRSIGMPSMNEFALLTKEGELMVGDFASVSGNGQILVAPQWYPSEKPPVAFEEGKKIFKKVVERSGARSLVSSHGEFVLGNLQEAIETM